MLPLAGLNKAGMVPDSLHGRASDTVINTRPWPWRLVSKLTKLTDYGCLHLSNPKPFTKTMALFPRRSSFRYRAHKEDAPQWLPYSLNHQERQNKSRRGLILLHP